MAVAQQRRPGGCREGRCREGREAFGRLVACGAEGIVLRCTELELLTGPDDSPVPLLPTTRLPIEAAIARCLDG